MASNGSIAAHSVERNPNASPDDVVAAARAFLWRFQCDADALPLYRENAQRDAFMRELLRQPEYGLLAGAVAIMTMKSVGWQWQLTGGPPQMRDFAHASLTERAEGGNGWAALLTKAAQDFYTQDKGLFIEVLDLTYPNDQGGKAAPLKPPAIGVAHLDAAQCEITRDPSWPVIYHNPATGAAHILHRTRVIHIADMSTPQWDYEGLGLCAVSRVFQRAHVMAQMGQVLDEMLDDMPPAGFFFLQNASWDDGEETAALSNEQKDNKKFRSIVVYDNIDPDHPVDGKFLPFAALPDNYNTLDEFQLTMLIFALAWGTDVRDFTALSGGELGTAAEAEVKHSKALHTGTAYFRRLLADALNHKALLATGVVFEWVEQDAEQELLRAEIQSQQVDAIYTLSTAGLLTREEARARLFEAGMLSADDLHAEEQAPDIAPQEGETRADAPAYTPETLGDPGPPATDEDARVICPDIERVVEIWRSIPELVPYAPDDDYLPEIPGCEIAVPRNRFMRAFMRQRPPARIPPGSREGLYGIYSSDMKRRADALVSQLANGEIGLFAWKEQARTLVKDSHVGAMAIGRGGWGEVTQSDWGRVGAAMRTPGGGQYFYLDNFAQDILAKAQAGETYSEGYLQNRFGMYIDSARQSFSNGAVAAEGINPSQLPAQPGDGTTRCKTRCKCHWSFEETSTPGLLDAYWILGHADHCIDCIERSVNWAPWGVVRVAADA